MYVFIQLLSPGVGVIKAHAQPLNTDLKKTLLWNLGAFCKKTAHNSTRVHSCE